MRLICLLGGLLFIESSAIPAAEGLIEEQFYA